MAVISKMSDGNGQTMETKTLVHHTGYEETELNGIAKKLNNYISNPPKQLTTIRSKYSHKVLYEVAKIPTLSDSDFV